jgi:two-component system, cell cycle sensor histidine kinase and response regulator CckA
VHSGPSQFLALPYSLGLADMPGAIAPSAAAAALALGGILTLVSCFALWRVHHRAKETEALSARAVKDAAQAERDLLEARAALVKAERRISQGQRMESMGRLVSGVAHDFNNLLTVIMGSAEIALASEDEPDAEALLQIVTAGEAAVQLTRRLLSFSKEVDARPEPLDVSDLTGDLEPMLRRLVREDIVISLDLSPDSWMVEAQPTHIHQLVLNLVVNASDAMPNGGRLHIRTGNVWIGVHEQSAAGVAPGHYVALSVSDTGVGIPPDLHERIMEPFFTTKGESRGTGLGLATCQEILMEMGGTLLLDSEVGVGTTFTMLMPAYAATALTPELGPKPARYGFESVLVVEDDDDVRRTMAKVLSQNGYVVTEARNGREAIDRVRARAGAFDLVLTDLVMPEMGGWELARRIGFPWSDVSVLFVSGYAEDLAAVPTGDESVLAKPFEVDQLLDKVRQILDCHRSGLRAAEWIGAGAETGPLSREAQA